MSEDIITYRVERWVVAAKTWVFVGLRCKLDEATHLRSQQTDRTGLECRIVKCETVETEVKGDE